MSIRTLATALSLLALAAAPVAALNPDDELWIPAAARGEGRGMSFWVTDLYVMNLADDTVTVEIRWLERDADNSDAAGEEFDIDGGETLVLEDVILEVFDMQSGYGGFHIEAVEEDGDKSADDDGAELIAFARVFNLDGSEATFGQGSEGLTSRAAISADDGPTHAIGVTHDADFRANWYGVNISEDEDDEAVDGEVMVELLDTDGDVLAAKVYDMPPHAPMLASLNDLGGPPVGNATVRFTMLEGEGIFGVSKIDRASNDPTTLETHWECDEGADLAFTDEFFAEDCTFSSTGDNPFYLPLEPGQQRFYEGEEDGEKVELRITVLGDTEMVDGVETRVVEEYETVDGEVVEISRNFLAICVETGSVFYFGEDVDIYEDGEIVSHAGAWRAGEDGNAPGILMPGAVLVGSRYFQEVAPGVALDQAHHVAMDVTVETAAGTFTDCLQVDETTPLEAGVSAKLYAHGVGLVRDDILDLVEIVEP